MFNITADELPRFMECNGSRLMSAAYPKINDDPTARNEGNAADWLASQMFYGTDPETLVNRPAPNGFYITGDMVDHVSSYLEQLDCGEMQVETSFGNDRWRVGARADHIVMRYEGEYGATAFHGNILTIDDLKYGWRLVEPERNWTLIAHAVGYCISRQARPDWIALRIHQPRPFHPSGPSRVWRITYDELMFFYQQIDVALSYPSDTLRTGISWCAKCRALPNCPAAISAGMNAIDAATVAFDNDIPNEALSAHLDTMRNAKAMIDAQLTALEEMTAYRCKAGAVIDNYGMVPQYANTRWKPGITSKAIEAMSRVDVAKDALCTPAEAIRRGAPKHFIDALTERPQIGTKLVRATADARAKRALKK